MNQGATHQTSSNGPLLEDGGNENVNITAVDLDADGIDSWIPFRFNITTSAFHQRVIEILTQPDSINWAFSGTTQDE
jgi:hypothetical protein